MVHAAAHDGATGRGTGPYAALRRAADGGLGRGHGRQGERLPPDESEQVATWTAGQVSRAKRRCDVAGQYGPHGFMLLLPRATDHDAVGYCRRLQAILEAPPTTPGRPLPPLQACFGVASYSPAASTIQSLLSRAEARLEQARSSACDRVAL